MNRPTLQQRLTNNLHYFGFLIVLLLVTQGYRIGQLSEKTLTASVKQQEALRNTLWVNLLTQRSLVLMLSPLINHDASSYERASQIASSVPVFLQGAGEQVQASPKVTSLLKLIQSTNKKLLAGRIVGTDPRIRVLAEVEQLGISLNEEESRSWYELVANNKQLLEDFQSRRNITYAGYALFAFYLGLLGWVSKRKKQAEALLKMSEGRLVNAAKMSALGEMAGGIAHEINTPLATIGILSEQVGELLNDEPLDRPMITGMTQTIASTVKRISLIIQGLRTFSRDGSQDRFDKIAVKQVIDNTLALCRERMKNSNVRLELGEFPDDLRIECQPVQISQVLLNLVGNACDAIASRPDKWIRIEADASDADWITISVTDSGDGIPEAVRKKLFQPFFTTKEIGMGTGLGLSISKGILESHKGCLSIDDTCANTRFVLHLKRIRGDSPALDAEA